jgi:PPOX class probable F420-dependent enzyme
MAFPLSRFLDVSEGIQPNQFTVGSHETLESLDDLDPIHKKLLDEPVAAVLAVVGNDGRANITPMWFDYSGDTVLLNVAAHRKKTEWIHKNPELTFLLVNPANAYHWVQIRATVANEIHEDDPENGHRAAEQVDKIWTKYTGNPPPYGLRDPSINERRILLECPVERVAVFGKP